MTEQEKAYALVLAVTAVQIVGIMAILFVVAHFIIKYW